MKTTLASEDEMSHLLYIISVDVLVVLIYYKLFHYFTLLKMSLKQLLVASYGKELYKQTSLIQQIKIKNAVARNQIIFQQRWMYHNITPKSFWFKTSIKSKKAFNIMGVYKKKLIAIAKNNTKERITKPSNLTNFAKV